MHNQTLKQKVVLIRHGETQWSHAGRHTSYTDLDLTEQGQQEAQLLRPILKDWDFSKVLSSPLQRARETCRLTGFPDFELDADLSEWNYGRYEGLTTDEIQKDVPHWDIFAHGCPEGESPEEVCMRVDRVIRKVRNIEGDVAVFSHGHLARVFAARWINLPVIDGHIFVLDTATLNILGSYHESPAIVTWNAKLIQ